MPSVDLAAGHGDELVLERAEIAGDQREQIGRLRERVVPDGEMAAAGKLACRDRIAVGQQQRRFLGVGLDADRVDRQDIGPVEEIGDAAKAFGLALRAIDAARPVKPHQRLVAVRRDLGLDGQEEAARLRRLGDHQPVRRRREGGGIGGDAVDLQALQRQPVAVERQRDIERRVVAPFDGEPGDDRGRIRRKPEGEVGLRDEIGAGTVVLQAKDLAGVGSHSLSVPDLRPVAQQLEVAALYTKTTPRQNCLKAYFKAGTSSSRPSTPNLDHEEIMTIVTPKFGMGASVLRVEDQTFITGHGRYTDDIAPERPAARLRAALAGRQGAASRSARPKRPNRRRACIWC